MQPAPTSAPPVSAVAPPFSAGSVVGKTFSIWRANFVPFSIVTLAVHAPLLVYAAITPEDGGPAWQLGESLVSGLAGFVTTGALTYGVLEHLRGGRAPLGALLDTGLRKMGWVFLVSLAVGLWTLVGFLLLVVPGVVWYCGLFVAVPAIVVEPRLGSGEALARSRALTRGSRWGILVVFLVVVVVTVASSAVAAGVAGVAEALLPRTPVVVLTTALVALGTTFAACAPAVAYHDLRVAKEGVATADLVKVFE